MPLLLRKVNKRKANNGAIRDNSKRRTNHWSEGGFAHFHHARVAFIGVASRLAQVSQWLTYANVYMTEPTENSLAFPALQTSRKSGDEHFFLRGQPVDLKLSAFWQWSSSDLVSNAMRGVLAEFLIASAFGLADGVRNQWDAFDFLLADKTRIEVKSAAYLQSWAHAKLSNTVFTIRPTLAWSSETNQLSSELRRQADIYIFCLLDHREKATLDPMLLEQWTFYLLRSAVLDQRFMTQKTISLASLLKLEPLEAKYENLAERVAELVSIN